MTHDQQLETRREGDSMEPGEAYPKAHIVPLVIHSDKRGLLSEVYHRERYAKINIPKEGAFIQDNWVVSRRNAVRGLHWQNPHPQGKLITVLSGMIQDVVVDLRRGSPGFMRWHQFDLGMPEARQLWIPPGYAHGFQTMTDTSVVLYKCTDLYYPEHSHTLYWKDNNLGICWFSKNGAASEKDNYGFRLPHLPPELLFP